MKTIIILYVLVAAAAAMRAQTSVARPAVVTANQPLPPALQKKEKAFADSLVYFTAHDYVAAEAALLAGNQTIRGTPQWEYESGSALIRVAFVFQSQYDAATSSTVARLALDHLRLAHKNYSAKTSAAEIANNKELIGYLYENFLGDRDQAKLSYRDAVKLSPDTGRAADRLATIARSETEENKKRIHSKGN